MYVHTNVLRFVSLSIYVFQYDQLFMFYRHCRWSALCISVCLEFLWFEVIDGVTWLVGGFPGIAAAFKTQSMGKVLLMVCSSIVTVLD